MEEIETIRIQPSYKEILGMISEREKEREHEIVKKIEATELYTQQSRQYEAEKLSLEELSELHNKVLKLRLAKKMNSVGDDRFDDDYDDFVNALAVLKGRATIVGKIQRPFFDSANQSDIGYYSDTKLKNFIMQKIRDISSKFSNLDIPRGSGQISLADDVGKLNTPKK